MLTRRICWTIMSFRWWSFPVFLWPRYLIQRWICKKKFDFSHSWWSKGQNKCEATSNTESSRLPWETRWREFRNMFRFDLLPFRNISTWFYFPCWLNLPWVNILTFIPDRFLFPWKSLNSFSLSSLAVWTRGWLPFVTSIQPLTFIFKGPCSCKASVLRPTPHPVRIT